MPTQKSNAKNNPAAKVKKSSARKRTDPPLTMEQQTFVEELIADRRMIAWKAYQRAFKCTNRKSCETASSRLLRSVKIQRAIQAAKDARLQRVRYSADEMFNDLLDMAVADTNEIIEYRRTNCRHCHGKGFAFQWVDHAEFLRNCEEVKRNTEEGRPVILPTNEGGYGYDKHAQPHPGCTNCGGEGYGSTHFHDTRLLTGGARLLYAGLKETQHGIEVKTHDQLAVRRLLMQHMGMLDPKLTLKGDKENPLIALLGQLQGNTLKPVDEGD